MAKQQQEQSTELAKANEQQLAVLAQVADEEGTGFEEAGKEAYAIPFVRILQSLSPEIKKRDPKYIEGAEEGMMLNTVANEIYNGETGLEVIPVHYAQRFVEWRSRDIGGGFVADYTPGTEPKVTGKDSNGRDLLANGNHLADTRNHYLLARVPGGDWFPVLVAMSSSQLKVSRKWMAQMAALKIHTPTGVKSAPMYSRIYKLSTTPESNSKGQQYFNFKVDMVGIVEGDDLGQALEFRRAIKGGAVEVKREEPAPEFGGTDDTNF